VSDRTPVCDLLGIDHPIAGGAGPDMSLPLPVARLTQSHRDAAQDLTWLNKGIFVNVGARPASRAIDGTCLVS
jgi:hypothetical protein